MVNALIIGNTILDRAFKEDKDITPMKLQKLIFVCIKNITSPPAVRYSMNGLKHGNMAQYSEACMMSLRVLALIQ